MITKKISKLKLVNVHISHRAFMLLVFLIVLSSGHAQTWSLQQCIDTALIYNRNLQISRNNISLSNEKYAEAKAGLIPKIILNADYRYYADLPYQFMPQSAFGGPPGLFKEIQMGVPHNITTNLQLAVPIYNSQILGGIEATKIATELNELHYQRTEEQVFLDISNLYYNAQILIHQLTFIDSNFSNTSRLLSSLQLLYSQLMIKKSDVERVELQKEQLGTQRELVENNLDKVMNSLKFSMGLPFEQVVQIDDKIQYQPGSDYAYSASVDLKIARAQNQILNKELRTIRNSMLPSITLYGSYGQSGYGYDEKPNEFLKFYPVSFAGLNLSVPLFNGTTTRRKINQKKVDIQNNKLQIDLIDSQNRMQVENAISLRHVKQLSIDNFKKQMNLAGSVYDEILLQQKEGTANLTDILMADNALREAQQNYLNAIIDYLKADLELKKLTGNITHQN